MISGIGSSGSFQSMAALWNKASRPDTSQMAQELFSSTDADGSGAITQEELTTALAAKSSDGKGPDATELFNTLDADGDGLVTESEHESGLAAMHKDLAQASMMTSVSMSMNQGASSMSDQLFAETDADGDGSITAEELADAIAAKNEESGGSVDAEELFAALDADGDGLITAAEHEAGLESLRDNNAPGMGGGQASASSSDDEEETYDAADTNEDGIVDAEELLASLGVSTSSETDVTASLFDALDADGDGALSSAEFSDVLSGLSQSGMFQAGGAPQGSQGPTLNAFQSANASQYARYQMMGMDAQSYLSGSGFSTTA
jgi:Ca2+-binding EF-hand superfamily protein